MASKRRQRRSACSGKLRYATHDEAEQARGLAQRRDPWPIRAYRCRYCRGYHIGHVPSESLRARQAAMLAGGRC